MYGRSRANKNRCSQKSTMFQNKIITEPYLYKPYLLLVKISESCILSIQFYAGSKFCLISTKASPYTLNFLPGTLLRKSAITNFLIIIGINCKDISTLHNVCAVHRGVCSTPGDFSTLGDVQYTGGLS